MKLTRTITRGGGKQDKDRKKHTMAHGDEAYKIKEETIKLNPNIMTIVCKLFVSRIAYTKPQANSCRRF